MIIKTNLSRRKFIKKTTAATIVVNCMFLVELFGFMLIEDKKIYLSKNSPLAVRTAVEILAEKIGDTIIEQQHNGTIKSGEIVFAVGEDVKKYPEAYALITEPNYTKNGKL